MHKLIPIQKDSRNIQTVNARDLHLFLEVGKDFSTWIKGRIKKYGFTEGSDFVVSKSIPQNGGTAIEYHLTLDMAKELSMVERSQKGKEARQYFIECERVSLQLVDPEKSLTPVIQTHAEALRLAADAIEKNEKLSKQIMLDAPKVAVYNRIAKADGLICITDTAKSLQIRPKDLFMWLSEEKWIYRGACGKGWIANENKVHQGFLARKVITIALSNVQERKSEQVLVTPKGFCKLAEILPAERCTNRQKKKPKQ